VRGALLDRDRLGGGLRAHLLEALAQDVGVHAERFAERLDERLDERVVVLALQVLAREDDVEGRARIDEEFPVAVEDGAARRRDAQQPHALVLGPLGVVVAVHDLQEVEPHAEHDEDGEHHPLDDRHPRPQVLCLVFEFHRR
jgi:hypothetical protein